MYRILVSDKLGAAALERLKEHADMSVDVKTGLSKEQLLEVIPEYDGLIVRSGTQVTADVLAAGKKLRVVGRAGVGVDNIDVKAATMSGVVVMNTPGANSMATAELTMALMLAVSRNIAQAHGSLKAGEWRRSDFVGVQLLSLIHISRTGSTSTTWPTVYWRCWGPICRRGQQLNWVQDRPRRCARWRNDSTRRCV